MPGGGTNVYADRGAPPDNTNGIQLEYLDRGLVAASVEGGQFLSWRLLADEVTGDSASGLTGAHFNVYRDGINIATVTDSTNYLDTEGTSQSLYSVAAVVYEEEVKHGAANSVYGLELGKSAAVRPWSGGFYDLPLQKPADGVTPAGEGYTYSANDMSVGDTDGDGQYEFFVKWDPSNSKDVSQKGYTGNTYVDAYAMDGTLKYRIDLGVNIRSGAHYTQMLVYDFDGDGRSELMFKTAPGTKVITYNQKGRPAKERYITMPREDIRAGYSHKDDYRMSSDDYYEHVVDMFMNWHRHEEVLNGHWPATLEECFGVEQRYEYPLSRADAEELADYFIDEYAPARSSRNDLRTFAGFIVDGPEYLTVFDGDTGKELDTVRYEPGRQDDGLMWGDYAMARIEPGNRVDRFLTGVAYLDGIRPSAVFARGYYTRSVLVTYQWDGEHLRKQWVADSGWTSMSNPFNDSPHGRDGTDPELGTLTTQGAHSLSVADVDRDGKDEIVYGSATVDHDGSLLYSSMDEMPAQSAAPGTIARLGHGDALHVTDIDPDRPGQEIFMVHEGGTYAPYGYSLRDAATGEVIYGGYTGKDTGRGMVGDIEPERRGLETWAVGLWTADGEQISSSMPGTNMNIKWAADMTTQIVNGAIDVTPVIEDWKRGVLLTADGTRTNNYTKGTPSLVADIFGDWREEMLVRKTDSSAIRIYLSTEVTDRKMYTLMHDAQYRTGVARQNMGYNQPSYTSFYLASDTNWADVPLPAFHAPGALNGLKSAFDQYRAAKEVKGDLASRLNSTLKQAQKQLEQGDADKAAGLMTKFISQISQNQKEEQISQQAAWSLTRYAQLFIGNTEK
ncbi:rhamnogalacturonan lyase [Paenibacillus sp. P96]|uniref:Rhamnogalacturonan lyase n=2 Tax=Paenibacillus zeirhizosphaerae TaxID=2987519 RepID=A0ABT9FWH9_9BACL|nr:rhamnogalacturonan lyase [Paenibacillus sp. P96]MDP4099077.1 rhamnogalacturonan lyase [Paenibacillus sp. P96]